MSTESRHILRLAVGGWLSFVLAMALGWPLPFLAAVLAVQLLSRGGPAPTLGGGLVILAVIAATSLPTLLVAQALQPVPLALVLVLGLIAFGAFLLDAWGGSPFVVLMLLISVAIYPLLLQQGPTLAENFAWLLFKQALLAVAVVFVVHALFPALPGEVPTPAIQRAGGGETRTALIATGILMPLVIALLALNRTDGLFLVMVTISILRRGSLGEGLRGAMGLLLGNLMGGTAATAAYAVLVAAPSIPLLILLLFAAGLFFGARIVGSAPSAPLHLLAFTTMLILLGIGLAPLLADTGEAFFGRLVSLLVASLYTIGMLSLFESLGRQPSPGY